MAKLGRSLWSEWRWCGGLKEKEIGKEREGELKRVEERREPRYLKSRLDEIKIKKLFLVDEQECFLPFFSLPFFVLLIVDLPL